MNQLWIHIIKQDSTRSCGHVTKPSDQIDTRSSDIPCQTDIVTTKILMISTDFDISDQISIIKLAYSQSRPTPMKWIGVQWRSDTLNPTHSRVQHKGVLDQCESLEALLSSLACEGQKARREGSLVSGSENTEEFLKLPNQRGRTSWFRILVLSPLFSQYYVRRHK